jgi:hypothetical protein
MTRQFKNLEKSIRRGEEFSSLAYAIRLWFNDHLRLVWNLVMMLILLCICFWVSYVAGSSNSRGSIIENVVPEIREVSDKNVEKRMKSAIRSAN